MPLITILDRPVGEMVNDIAIGAGSRGFDYRAGKSDTMLPPLRRCCVGQALGRGDGPHHWLHTSAQYREYNEDLISVLFFLKEIVIQQEVLSSKRKK